MTTANIYLAKSAKLAGTVHAGAVSFAISRSAQPVEMRSDGELYPRKSFLVGVVEHLVVELRDFAQAPALGATGETVLTGVQHAGGVSLTGGATNRICTAALSTVEGVEHSVDINGQTSVRVTLSVQSADGVASGIVWTTA